MQDVGAEESRQQQPRGEELEGLGIRNHVGTDHGWHSGGDLPASGSEERYTSLDGDYTSGLCEDRSPGDACVSRQSTVNSGHQHGNTDESLHVEAHANVNVNRFTLPKDPREIMTAVILALSILVNIALFMQLRHTEQTVDLDRYDDNTFINGRFADLASQVRADHDLIQAYGLQKTLKEK